MKRHVLFVVGLMLMIAACASPTPTPAPSPTTEQRTATAAPTATVSPVKAAATATTVLSPTPGPKDMLLASLNSALSKIKTYRVQVTQEARLIEVVLPDRFHQIETDDVVLIGTTLWPNSDTRKPQSVSSVPYFDRVNLLWVRDSIGVSPQVKLLGPSVINGKQTIGYSVDFEIVRVVRPRTPGPTPQIIPLPAQVVKVWFNTTDGFPLRVEYGAPVSATANFYDFNAKIEVNPP